MEVRKGGLAVIQRDQGNVEYVEWSWDRIVGSRTEFWLYEDAR